MRFSAAVLLLSTSISLVEGFSGLSAFTGQSKFLSANSNAATATATATGYRSSLLMYENEPSRSSSDHSSNVWSVLASTEKWISETLASADMGNGNPYSRKEVNYVCETNEDSPMIAANMFKRLREARELGQRHGVTEEDRKIDQGVNYHPHTLRQTQVMVIPGNKDLSNSFQTFDKFINAINTARRNARDYITDSSLEKLDQEMSGEATKEWSVSVNCAHLHPDFGKKSPEEQLKQLKQEEASGEVDVNAQEYAEKRMLARQSPYPTIVVEVRSTPPPNWGQAGPPPPSLATAEVNVDDEDDTSDDSTGNEQYDYNRKEFLKREVTASDVQKLEALFGKAAATEKNCPGEQKTSDRKKQEESFYDALGSHFEEISSISPMRMAQEWIKENDEKFSPETSAFTESPSPEIDHAYEFVFTNLAMQREQAKQDKTHASRRQYLVMPHFLSSSATSLEKFTKEVMNIVFTLPDIRSKVIVSTFHPEHVMENRRSPMPIICLQWTEQGEP